MKQTTKQPQDTTCKFRMLLSAITFFAGLALLFAALALPSRLAAQAKQDHSKDNKHHHYKLIDLGTFGGPASYFTNGFDGILNNHGAAAQTQVIGASAPGCNFLIVGEGTLAGDTERKLRANGAIRA